MNIDHADMVATLAKPGDDIVAAQARADKVGERA